MNINTDPPFIDQVTSEIDNATQVQCGRDIENIISELGKTIFENIAKEHVDDKKSIRTTSGIKNVFNIAAITLACVAIVCAIAGIFFSMGFIAVGGQTLALITGFVGVTAAFGQLDNAIHRYINTKTKEKEETTRLEKLKVKVNIVKELIGSRIKTLDSLNDDAIKNERCSEILSQIKRINEFVMNIKANIPDKIASFQVVDASPLLKYAVPK